MADNTRPEIQRDCVICDEEYQIAFWTDHFGVSREVLLDVVRRVGPKTADVTAHLVIGADKR